MSNLTDNHWHIIYVREKWEKKTSVYLQKKGIEFFCPFQKTERPLLRIHSGEPVLAGYIFVKTSADKLRRLKSIPGVLNIVYWLDKPARIRDEDMSALQGFLNNHPVSRTERIRLNFEAHTTLTNILRDNRGSNPSEFITYTSILEFPAIGYTFIAENIQVDAATYSYMKNKKTTTAKALPALNA
jgi:transcription antitermination factor NusG